ncbi:epidermal growth factor-like protein [Sitodiplosis mosellana]|uniref:epidermal growth factor-like protein n=1 Tax=Sitodiplosis mosellana TaxID=263140 RepID=UPI0024442A3A|nr:epidermal growth factor-like protein [Sitodiplosis mosellana]
MYSISLLNAVLAIVCLSVSTFVVIGVTDSEDDNHRVIIGYNRIMMSEPQNETYIERIRKNCGARMCLEIVNRTRTVWKNGTKIVPIYKCRDGYKELNGVCTPICTNDCEYGTCVAPEHCECFVGYASDENDLRNCNPVCDGCEHGKCISPNICTCNDDYQWDADQNKCDPICESNCPNGKCIAPNKCACNENYHLDETLNSCMPECKPDRINGQCISPNRCQSTSP